MDRRSTRVVMEDYLQALLDQTDFARFFAPDVVWTTMETGEQVRGRDAVRDLIVGMHTQVFDAQLEPGALVTGDGVAMLEAVFRGTHTGEFAGLPATGRHVRLSYCMAYELDDGAISALRAYFPIAALRAQLAGAVPAVGAPSHLPGG